MSDPIVWLGSGSAVSGNTPYGFYDTDAQFVADAMSAAKWAALRLGYPIQDVELSDSNFYAAYEQSVTEYGATVNDYNIRQNLLEVVGSPTGSNITGAEIRGGNGKIIRLAENYGSIVGAGGDVSWYKDSIDVISGTQEYNLNDLSFNGVSGSSIRIKQIFHGPTPASRRFYGISGYDFNSAMSDSFGFDSIMGGTQFVLRPLYEDLLRMTRIELSDQIRKSSYSFELHNNKLTLFPIPTSNYKLWIQYTVKDEEDDAGSSTTIGVVSDHHNIPYNNLVYSNINAVGKHWIKKWFLAECKEMLGIIRSKYPTIPIPDGEVSLDGDSLKQMAESEKERLKEELKETLEATSKKAQMELKSEEAEQQQKILNKYPLNIYIG